MDAASSTVIGRIERARWLLERLEALPDPAAAPGWKEGVLINQKRRDAEFALAAALQRMNAGRPAVTYSAALGTTVRMFGVRASSDRGFEAACRLWIDKVLQRRVTPDLAPQRE